MTNTTQQIQTFLGQLAACFPGGVRLTKEMGAEYVESLRIPLKSVDLLVLKERLKKRSEFFPTIRLILEEAALMKQQAREFSGGPTPIEKHVPMEPERLRALLTARGFTSAAKKLGST